MFPIAQRQHAVFGMLDSMSATLDSVSRPTPFVQTFVPASPLPGRTPDPDFEARWTAWVHKGRAHEQRVRRRAFAAAAVLVPMTLTLYALFSDALRG